MRPLRRLEEFQREASGALFTKQQAVTTTLRLLESEQKAPENTPEETQLFTQAMQKVEYRYLDSTNTATDQLLDSLSVPRFTASQIVQALQDVLFDVQ
ncbi:MAG: hypothetical protein HFJ86_10610 [Oscillospiraceae bacterium]|jgi:hypothetical protein|nr:hypothetical protein [Oscillospiraceae bacterium]